MNNQSAYENHLTALKVLSVAYGNEPSASRAARLRALIGKLRDELYEMVKRDLESNSAEYAPLDQGFRSGIDELKWARNQANTFVLAADQIAKLMAWATSIIPLL